MGKQNETKRKNKRRGPRAALVPRRGVETDRRRRKAASKEEARRRSVESSTFPKKDGRNSTTQSRRRKATPRPKEEDGKAATPTRREREKRQQEHGRLPLYLTCLTLASFSLMFFEFFFFSVTFLGGALPAKRARGEKQHLPKQGGGEISTTHKE